MFTSQNAAGGLTAVRIGRYLPALLWFAASCLMSGSTALAQKESGTTYRIDGAEVDVPFDYVQHQILVRAFAGSSDRLTF
ncbi:MAG TPA: hypothetical protein VGS41_16195, partial [Chthonomonadales bacterium]|nr:hypothetical protein [Chthonomonadales bacterium]